MSISSTFDRLVVGAYFLVLLIIVIAATRQQKTTTVVLSPAAMSASSLAHVWGSSGPGGGQVADGNG